MKDDLKRKLVLLSLVASLSLTGCSNSNKTSKKGNDILVEYDNKYNDEQSIYAIDNIFGFNSFFDKENLYGKKLNYDYLIDNTNLTRDDFINIYNQTGIRPTVSYASLARLVDETTITDDFNSFDGKRSMTTATFWYFQIIQVPDSLKDEMIYKDYVNYEMNCKKLVSIHGATYYNIISTITFTENVKSTNYRISKDDYLRCECLYELVDGTLLELSRNQTGLGSTDANIINSNFNNASKVVIPVEETPFSILNGEYSKDYIYKALETYSGKENFSTNKDDDLDYSVFKKIVTN